MTQPPLFSITPKSIIVTDSKGNLQAELSLTFGVGAKTYQVRELRRVQNGWIGLTNDAGVTVAITSLPQHLSVELRGPFGPGQDITYFRGSSVAASHMHAFIPDDNLGSFSVSQDRTFTLTNQAAMRQRLGLKESLWMLAPQPHVLAFGDSAASGFSLSIPECLSSDAMQFIVKNRRFQMDFLHYVAECLDGRMPTVYIDLGINNRQEALSRHLGHARDLGLVIDQKVQPAWWHNPLYCTWGDQCRLGLHGVHKDSSLTPERILAWADRIREFYKDEVNFIIDDGYFLGMGDFRLRPELYPSIEGFRNLIAELKKRQFRVILWYTPFWVDKNAAVVSEHPEWLLQRRDGILLDETGDWKDKYHFDWTQPEVREHQRALIHHFLTDLDADGFKIDMTYACPPTREVLPHDPAWASGNLVCKRVVEFIHTVATAIKPDVFLTVNGVESYLQPFASAVRLNDLFDMTNASAWYRRAELVVQLMPGVAIDVDGWPGALSKLREYPFVASVFGAPVTYYLDGTEVGDEDFGDAEINRMASIWNTYSNAPVHGDQRIIIDAEKEIFERRDADGTLKATSLGRKVFVTYGETIRVTANASTAVSISLENCLIVSKAERIGRDGTRVSIPLHIEAGRALFYAEDSAEGILYYELS